MLTKKKLTRLTIFFIIIFVFFFYANYNFGEESLKYPVISQAISSIIFAFFLTGIFVLLFYSIRKFFNKFKIKLDVWRLIIIGLRTISIVVIPFGIFFAIPSVIAVMTVLNTPVTASSAYTHRFGGEIILDFILKIIILIIIPILILLFVRPAKKFKEETRLTDSAIPPPGATEKLVPIIGLIGGLLMLGFVFFLAMIFFAMSGGG